MRAPMNCWSCGSRMAWRHKDKTAICSKCGATTCPHANIQVETTEDHLRNYIGFLEDQLGTVTYEVRRLSIELEDTQL